MLLFHREVQTTGDMEKIMPLLQDFASIAKSSGMNLHTWAGYNGCVAGTVQFNVNYENLAEGAEMNAKLQSQKAWWETLRKFREHVISTQADTVYTYMRGGTTNVDIPIGTFIQQNYFQYNGSDFVSALTWMNELVELAKSITGVDANIGTSTYGTLGHMGYFAGYASMAQIDEAREKLMANPEWFPKFLEGQKYSIPGTVVQRHIVKIA
jgi:hypothetical protein